MKTSLTDDIKAIFTDARKWLELQVEYCKLTGAEKVSVLMGALVAGAVCMLLGGIFLVLIALCLVTVFQEFLSPCLAYLCVAGICLLLMAFVMVFRKQLIGNVIAKFITRVLLDKKSKVK